MLSTDLSSSLSQYNCIHRVIALYHCILYAIALSLHSPRYRSLALSLVYPHISLFPSPSDPVTGRKVIYEEREQTVYRDRCEGLFFCGNVLIWMVAIGVTLALLILATYKYFRLRQQMLSVGKSPE